MLTTLLELIYNQQQRYIDQNLIQIEKIPSNKDHSYLSDECEMSAHILLVLLGILNSLTRVSILDQNVVY